MKAKIITALLFFIYAINAKSQITLEHSYPTGTSSASLQVVNLSVSGYKYALIDYTGQQVKLYNLNHSLWKTINTTTPNGYTILGIYNISETLFNLDNSVELTYSYYQTSPSVIYEVKVINESGSVILTIPNSNYAYAISTGANGTKLLATIVNSPNNAQNVYSLPGDLVTAQVENEERSSLLGFGYPNPTQNQITIPYNLPQGCKIADLIIYDITGNEIQKYRVDKTFNNLLIDASTLSKGQYIYRIFSDNNLTEAKTFIVN
jgi:hypothetical protein